MLQFQQNSPDVLPNEYPFPQVSMLCLSQCTQVSEDLRHVAVEVQKTWHAIHNAHIHDRFLVPDLLDAAGFH